MIVAPQDKKYVVVSCVFHAAIFLVLALSYHAAQPLAVIENTSQHDVISAVVLGDTDKSKIMPHEEPSARPEPRPEPEKSVPPASRSKTMDSDVIALKAAALKKKQQALFAKDLLADMKKLKEKKKIKAKKKDLQNPFAKMLREQSELSLRQNLLNEKIKLKGKLSRQAQGVVNKYKALIVQAISENWLVPLQANKSLTSELMIKLAPGGMVLDVQITRSSGDKALDSSARAAVLKSSPLPVPNDPEEFEPFRQFVLKVKPENIIES